METDTVQAALRTLPREAPPTGGLAEALGRVTTTAQQLFSADGAGIMLIDDEQALTYVQTDDEGARRLESAQRDVGHGPCVDCLVLDRTIRSNDVQGDHRWPELRALLEGSPVRAVLGVPIRVGGGAVGSLNVYRGEAGPWDDTEVEAIHSFARVVEDLVGAALLARSNEQVAEQLQRALQNRKLIERAIGFLMAEQRTDAVTAFDGLRRRAREQRRKVAELAAEVLGDDGTPRPKGD
jgi:GAF domain-containing protein